MSRSKDPNPDSNAPALTVGKPQIAYPCDWPYTVIGEDAARIEEGIHATVGDAAVRVRRRRSSRTGRFCSYHATVRVADERQRDEIFQRLQAIASVKVVL
mgnify:FL=1